ncbi:MAG TPA: hypothetical protein VJB87_03400 [Candidatus Nanoarchaeia archaeon]|nr:hypothetical protein [Candidatus Nanoarchaeia archaeon]
MERVYTITLRKEIAKVPVYKHTMKAVKGVREFLQKHMKNDNVKLGQYLNRHLNSRGRKNPPTRVKVNVWTETIKKDNKDFTIVRAELFGAPKEAAVKEQPVKEKKVQAVEKKDDKQAAIKETVEKLEKKPQPAQQEKATAKTPEDKHKKDSAKTTSIAQHGSQHHTETKK